MAKKNEISRTGTYTSSDGDTKTYYYKGFTAAEITAGSDGYSGTDYYSNDDLENESIFVDIDSKVRLKFTQEIDSTSVISFNKDVKSDVDKQNKKGSIGLTHVVNPVPGAGENNLKALELTSTPVSIAGLYDNTANQEIVEMSSEAITGDNQTYEFTPKASLSSNTTYFLRIDTDKVVDIGGTSINYPADSSKGFVTDNTKSFVTTGVYYTGFTMQTEKVDLTGTEKEPDTGRFPNRLAHTMSLYRTTSTSSSATSLKILAIDGTKLTYQLEPASYKMNVSYTATNPIVITSVIHDLLTDDRIEVYDIVSGSVVETGTYAITKIDADTFSIPVDGTESTVGALNYYRNVDKDDTLVWSETVAGITYHVRKKAISIPKIISNDRLDSSDSSLSGKGFLTIKDTVVGSTTAQGNFIKQPNSKTISYVPIDSDGKITQTDAFVNNSIVDITTSYNPESDILHPYSFTRFHIKANTSPDHNVHPFHSSAPKVMSTFPEDGASFPRKLTITQILRRESIATVSTNHPHNLFIGDAIQIVGSTQAIYNKSKLVLATPTSTTFQYDLLDDTYTDLASIPDTTQSPAPGNPKLWIGGAERYNAIFVNFSQSMNTSTVTVSDGTNIISANGTSAAFAVGQDSASSTIQLSDSGFEDLVNLTTITPSEGNSVFSIVPEILVPRHRYKIKATKDIQDLGKTNSIYTFETTTGVSTGVSVINSQTGQETVYSKDEDPPEIKKISFTSAGTDGVAGMVLESDTASEITSPGDYQAVDIDLDAESILIQFSEGMKLDTVTTATTGTVPTGSVQLSSDNYNTVVQMTTGDPVVTTTTADNDTFKFTPSGNLSANTVYTLKVLRSVRDDSPEQNQMLTTNVSTAKVLTVNAVPASATNYYVPGETISGVRTLQISAHTGTPTIGLTAGDVFLGLTSKGKGKVLDFTGSSPIETIRYTELPGENGTITPLTPGEVCKVFAGPDFTIDRYGITDPPEGNVVSFTAGTKKLIYRDNNPDNEFVSGSASSERIVGRTSNGYAFGHVSTGIVGPGLKTATTAISANVFFLKYVGPDDYALVSPIDGNQTAIHYTSNLTVTFNQTMNVESINFNARDEVVRNHYNILLSYDSNFQNTIPLSPSFTSSDNDTTFEFQPAILSNTSLHLTQNKNLYAKITQTAKNKGDMNLASVFAPSNYANTRSDVAFESINASVMAASGYEIDLGTGTGTSAAGMPSQSSIILAGTPIVIHLNEVPLLSTFAFGSGNEIQLSSLWDFSSGIVSGTNATLKIIGLYGTQIHVQLGAALTAGTRYYLRVITGGTSEGGKAMGITAQYFNSFTIHNP